MAGTAQNTPQTPQKGFSEPSYAVHRPSHSDAGPSNSVNPDEHGNSGEDDRPNTPPPYSGPTTTAMTAPQTPQPQPTYPGLPRLNYRLYSPDTFTLSEDLTTITSYSPTLSTYPQQLMTLIQQLATVPPKPQVRIMGKSADGTVDFDVRVNIMNLVVSDEERKGRMNYVKLVGPGEAALRGETKESSFPHVNGLENWVKTYCEDGNSIKQFTLERTLINWDTSYLEGRLLTLINSTNYRGHTTVSFPLTHSKVTIHSPDKVNRFFSNVTKVFTGTKKYAVIKSIWPYADVPRGESGRKCAVQEEESWFNGWKDAIRHAVVCKRKGWVTVEDRLEFLMEPKAAELGNAVLWGRS